MSVISVKEMIGARRASVDDKDVRHYSRSFRVITDDRLDGPAIAGGAIGVPRLFELYVTPNETDLAARVKSISPRQQTEESPFVWEVEVEYSTNAQERDDNPLARPAEVSWSFSQFQRIAERDINGQGVLNSAGQYFDPPPEIDDSRPVLTITRNEAAFSPAIAIDYQDAVNSDPFYGFAIGQVKVAGISASSQYENGLAFWKVTYEFHMRREGWRLEILDQGRYSKTTAFGSTVWQPIKDEDDNPVADPVPLDGNGAKLPSPSPSTVVYLPFTVYKSRPFLSLGL